MTLPQFRWLEYAQRDLEDAELLFRESRYPLCSFICQQAAEKSLKAFLVFKGQLHPKSHSLLAIAQQCKQLGLELEPHDKNLQFLDLFYIPARYPDAPAGILPEGEPTKEDAHKALEIAKQIAGLVRSHIK